MPRRLVDPPELGPTPGFTHVAIGEGTRIVCIAGQVALDADLQIVGGDDLHAQTTRAMENVGVALRAAGAGWDDVVRRTIYTTRPTEWETIARAIEQVTAADGADPAQTIIGVTGLAIDGLLIEIECTAVV